MKRVGIIDDGIGIINGNKCIQWEWNNHKWQKLNAYNVLSNSHGTNIAEIIKSYNPDVEIYGLKVLNENGWGDMISWLEAMQKATSLDTLIWNLSNGTTEYSYYEKIKYIVEKTEEIKCIFVAARSNRGIFTVPACLKGVVGVSWDAKLPPNTLMVNPKIENDINIRANLEFPIKNLEKKEQIRIDYSSYQTAAITGILSKKKIVINNISDKNYFFDTLSEVLQPEKEDDYKLIPWKDEDVIDKNLKIPIIVVKGDEEVISWCRGLGQYLREKGSYAVITYDEKGKKTEVIDECLEDTIWEERKTDNNSWIEYWKRIWQKHRCDIIVALVKEEVAGWDMCIDMKKNIIKMNFIGGIKTMKICEENRFLDYKKIYELFQ